MLLGSKFCDQAAAAEEEEAQPLSWVVVVVWWEWWRISRTAGIGAATRFRWVPVMLLLLLLLLLPGRISRGC